MADIIGLYYKAGGVESGGTNALTGLLTGGTRLSMADAETSAFAFPALDTVYTLYYKAEDSATFDDVGKDTSSTFVITAPTGVELCTTYNGSFGGTATVAAATGAYKPVYAKQTARQAAAAANLSIPDDTAFTTGTRPTVGTVTPTAGDASVVLAWDDIAMTGTGVYQVERATDDAFTTNLVTLTSTLADGSTGYTNNAAGGNAPSNGTAYYYRVRAVDARGVGAWSATGSVTPAQPALGQVGTVTPTVGDTQVALDWADVTNATGYTIEYMASASEPASWTGASSTTSATSAKTVTGLTNATKYYFRVKATASGYTDGAWSAAANGTPEASSSSITGTYYVDGTVVTGSLRRLDTTATNAGGIYQGILTAENGGSYARASYRMVVVNSAGTVQRTVKDWTAIGADLTTEATNQTRTTGATQSFSNPAVTTGEYFGVQFRVGDGIENSDSAFFVLPVTENPGPQSGMTVSVSGLTRLFEEEDVYAALLLTESAVSYASIVFAGA